jgi:hypothetical protein
VSPTRSGNATTRYGAKTSGIRASRGRIFRRCLDGRTPQPDANEHAAQRLQGHRHGVGKLDGSGNHTDEPSCAARQCPDRENDAARALEAAPARQDRGVTPGACSSLPAVGV